MNMKKISKPFLKWGIQCLVVAVLFGAVVLFTVPIRINKQVACIEIKIDDPLYCKECFIEFNGEYHLNLLCDSYFSGKIAVSSFPDTSNGTIKVVVSKDWAPMFYKRIDNKYEEFVLGSLVSNGFFSKFAILVYSDNARSGSVTWKTSGGWGGWSSVTGYCIVSNCNDYKSAVQVLQSLDILPQS